MELLFTVENGLYDVQIEYASTFTADESSRVYEEYKTLRAVSASEVRRIQAKHKKPVFRVNAWEAKQ
jgi:hypothetical protein